MCFNRIGLGIAGIAIATLIAATAPARSEKILKAAAGNPGAASHAIMTIFAKIANRETGTSIQINDGQTLTKTTLALGLGKLDLSPSVPAIIKYLGQGTRMYRKIKDRAQQASGGVRGIMGWMANWFHPVVFADRPIKAWADIKGKRVFTGPPSGAAAVTAEMIIRIATGYKPNVDYKAIRLNWGAGLQAMMDGQLDLYMRPAPMGAAMIEQLGLSRKFRLLTVPKNIVASAGWKKLEKIPGRLTGVIPAGTYKGQIGDQDVTVGAATMILVANKGLNDDLVYRMTKAFWDNLAEVHTTVHTLKSVDKKQPFLTLNTPLHRGALKYYREAGMTIPASLVPPEAN